MPLYDGVEDLILRIRTNPALVDMVNSKRSGWPRGEGSVWLKREQSDLFSRSALSIKFDNLHNFLESKLLRRHRTSQLEVMLTDQIIVIFLVFESIFHPIQNFLDPATLFAA
jgi:hypothetical protein